MRICKIKRLSRMDRTESLHAQLETAFRNSGLTQSQLALFTGVNQSQISRILAGSWRRISGNVMQVCKYYGIEPHGDSERLASRRLESAALEMWDGTSEHERILLSLFGAMKLAINESKRSK